MDLDDVILRHTQIHYPNESKLIESNLIDYYYHRLNKNKSRKELFHQEMILESVIDLFKILSLKLIDELDYEITSDEILEHLKRIHIKT